MEKKLVEFPIRLRQPLSFSDSIFNRRCHPLLRTLAKSLTVLSLALCATAANAQSITLIVGTPAGSSADRQARALAMAASTSLGRPVLIDNKLGAGGKLAEQYVANASPDGSVLLFQTGLGKATVGALSPVAQVGEGAVVLYARTGISAAQVLGDQKLVAVGGIGTPSHLVALLLAQSGRIGAVVPYAGDAAATMDARAQDMLFLGGVGFTPPGFSPIAASSDGMAAKLGLPAFSSLGLAASSVSTFTGVFAPPATSATVIGSISQTFMQAARSPDFIAGTQSMLVTTVRDAAGLASTLAAGHQHAIASGSPEYREMMAAATASASAIAPQPVPQPAPQPYQSVASFGNPGSASNTGNAGSSGYKQAASGASTNEQCRQNIMAIHQQAANASAAARTPQAARAAEIDQMRSQKDLFTGRCAGYPGADQYVATANRTLGESGSMAPGSSTSAYAGKSAMSDPQCSAEYIRLVSSPMDDGQRQRQLVDLYEGPCAASNGASTLLGAAKAQLGNGGWAARYNNSNNNQSGNQTSPDRSRLVAAQVTGEDRTACVKRIVLNGGTRIQNTCSDAISVSVCVTNRDHWWGCGKSGGLIGLAPGNDYPVPDLNQWPGDIHYAACKKPANPSEWNGEIGAKFVCKF